MTSWRTAVRDRVRLRRLTFRVAERTPQPITVFTANHVHRVPEFRRAHLVRDILEHAGDLAATNLVEQLAAELRVIALLVDREGPVTDDRDAAIGRGNEVVPPVILFAGQERH